MEMSDALWELEELLGGRLFCANKVKAQHKKARIKVLFI